MYVCTLRDTTISTREAGEVPAGYNAMTTNAIERLKAAREQSDLAALLGYRTSAFHYVLYGLPENQRYRAFTVPKRSGDARIIHEPMPALKELQARLSKLLFRCAENIGKARPGFWATSHGFRKGRSIVTGANIHSDRQSVFNADIHDFFGTINYARVCGFFLKDSEFELAKPIATAIAQIACYKDQLPQGSPCSPVISNYIGAILDNRLGWLARRNHCSYTRYADDLTFSTQRLNFPEAIAVKNDAGEWVAGIGLENEIDRSGFSLNPAKTRMQQKPARQSVTGLVVNKHPNVSRPYYRHARAMCASLFSTGEYSYPPGQGGRQTNALAQLEGRLAHIDFVQSRAAKEGEGQPKGPKRLYSRFLYFKHFTNPERPVIITERPSDIILLKCALRHQAQHFRRLTRRTGQPPRLPIDFLKSPAKQKMGIASGSDGLAAFMASYSNEIASFEFRPMRKPVIMLIGGPNEAREVLYATASEIIGTDVSGSEAAPFFHLSDNLYLVRMPILANDSEELLPPVWIERHSVANGETLAEAKSRFARRVVFPNQAEIDFSGFAELLRSMDTCIAYHSERARRLTQNSR